MKCLPVTGQTDFISGKREIEDKTYLSFRREKNFLTRNEFRNSREDYINDLEWAVIDDYPHLQYIKQKYPKSVMTGSGSTYFMIDGEFENENGYWVKNGLKSLNFGVREV